MIDRATVDKIMDATNIVDVVSEFVNLRKAGVNYKGLCPFHDDKTPSFMVSPSKQICHCFACGEGGNAVNFLMKHEQITYPEALRWLAKKYNIEIQERELTDDERREQSERESMLIVNEWASQYFHEILNNNVDGIAIGKQYFRSRGIRDDIIKKFQLGFALTKRDALSNEAHRKGYKDEFLVKTGLCYRKERKEDIAYEGSATEVPSSQLIDRFAGRAIFPWFNVSGKVVAFGGRKLDAATKGVQQKYVNSPDSDIYHKERELYGIYQAKKAIVKEDCVYMVEGYTDVIAMHQCGLENVVANSGTALSVYQIRLLRRFTQNIILLYDGDEAGIHAAMRGTDMLLQESMNVKVLLLPDGDDPDSFSRKHTATEFKQYIEQHQTDFIQFKTDLLLHGVSDPIKRAEAINNIVRSISVIPDPIVRSAYLTDCSQRLGVDERTLITQTNKYIAINREEQRKEAARAQNNRMSEGTDSQGYASSSVPQSDAPGTNADSYRASVIPVATPTVPHDNNSTSHHITETPVSAPSEVERMLAQAIVRYGEMVIFKGLETEDGQLINLNVAQFIDYDLSSDGLRFSNEQYNQLLQEAVEHSADEGFKAETYFTQHPDTEISQLATTLSVDNYQLGGSFEMKHTQQSMQQHIQHLVLDFRYIIVKQRLETLNIQLKQTGMKGETLRELMTEYMETNKMYQELGKKLGR